MQRGAMDRHRPNRSPRRSVSDPIPIDRNRGNNQPLPPHDMAAEESLLGCMLLTAAAIDAAAGIVTADSYYKPAHANIHHAVVALHDQGEPADPVTVADQLRRDGLLEHSGGPAALTTLQANAPATTNAARYAHTVADMATLRRLDAVGREITGIANGTPADVTGAVDQAEQLLHAITDTAAGRSGEGRLIGEHIPGWLDRLENLYDRGEPPGIRTGLADLDRIIVGLQPGQLIVVGARPSMGKSALGFQVARAAAEAGHPTLLVNIEMGTNETLDRMVASDAQVDLTRIRTGKLIENDWPRISHAVGRLDQLPLWEYNNPSATIAGIRSEVRRRHRQGLELVVVDYLQLVQSAKGENRQTEVADLSKGLRNIARTFNVPVVALAQLSRQLELRANKRPQLADLRESGQIEADADVAIGIYRDEVYNEDSKDRGIAELIVLKQRNGPLGTCRCQWDAQYGRYANLSRI
jgi:replicative DNA helicase